MTAPLSEDDLHAYADNRLDAARRTQVEAWLAGHPDERAQVEAWRAQGSLLHQRYDGVLDEAVPGHLVPPANRPWRPPARAVLAAGLWLLAGIVIGWLTRAANDPRPDAPAAMALAQRAAVAHAVFVPEVKHPVEVGADQQAHLVAWLSKRLGASLRAPALDGAGYTLVGGRLLPGDRSAVAQFMYQGDGGQRLTLYLQPHAEGMAAAEFRYARENGVDVFYWVDGGFGYALSGNTGREDMLRLATLVHRQLAVAPAAS